MSLRRVVDGFDQRDIRYWNAVRTMLRGDRIARRDGSGARRHQIGHQRISSGLSWSGGQQPLSGNRREDSLQQRRRFERSHRILRQPKLRRSDTGRSRPLPFRRGWAGNHDDGPDGADLLKWISEQTWSYGKVGTMGTSYGGATQHAMAIANAPNLSAMVPVDAMTNVGRVGIRHNGAFELRWLNWILTIGNATGLHALANGVSETPNGYAVAAIEQIVTGRQCHDIRLSCKSAAAEVQLLASATSRNDRRPTRLE